MAEQEHGTVKGYRQHRYRRTVPCRPCMNAMAIDSAPRSAARGRAVARLTKEYAERFRVILREEIDRQKETECREDDTPRRAR